MWKTLIDRSFKSLKESFVHTPRSLALAWKASPGLGLVISILTLCSALLPLGVAYAGKKIIDSVVERSVEEALRWVLFELGLIAFQSLIQRGLFLMRSVLGARLGTDVNIMILEKALQLDLTHFEDPKFYDMLSRARREASSRPVTMVTDSLQLLQNLMTLAAYAVLLFSFSVWAVAGLLLSALPATIAEMKFSNAAFRLRNWRSPDTRRLNYVEYVLANDEHVKEVKVYGLGPMLMSRYRDMAERFFREDTRMALSRSFWAFFLSLLAVAAFYACYFVMAKNAALGLMTLGNLTLYIVAFRQGQQAFQSCLTAIGSMYESNLYMSNLFEFLGLPISHSQTHLSDSIPVELQTGLNFENVGFHYPGSENWALRNINLAIPTGQSLALVGHNGAGKTTFIKLLCGLYQPTEGRILLDGKDLRAWKQDELLKRIGVVFQDFNHYQFTLGENVGVGSVDHIDETPRLYSSLAKAGAEHLHESYSKGLATPLGRWFQDGVELSGGQWQKIALARAFMREEADILILDEPTAALDAEAEQAIFERFRMLTKGRTTILISHRFPTVRTADRIVVIEGGKIVEEGSHETLVAKKGRYAHLFSLQAQGYL
jgi:ATP-binding cassette subfamily B protein